MSPDPSEPDRCRISGSIGLRMSKHTDADPPTAESAFACGIEASALLNCVASKQYSEAKCKPLLQKLRSCIEKKVRSAEIRSEAL